MMKIGSWRHALIGILAICLVSPATLFAQDTPAKTFKQEELDQLLAPVALYPDDLLTQVLVASTYPLEVVQAERWMKQNKSLKGDALKAALDKQTWDSTVKALVSFPDVLSMMSEKLEWTQKLGDAFLAQQKDVMDTVQKLRRKALEAGNLKSSKELEVKKETDVIIIEPANPQVVYVPAYNPTVVYGPWPYPAYPPYPVYVYPPGAAMFTFSMGVAVGYAWGGWHNDWHGGAIYPPPPPPPPPPGGGGSRPPPPSGQQPPAKPGTQPPAKPGTGQPGQGAKPEQWKHNPEHRQGVAYRDQATREKYTPTNRAAVDSRQGNRGYEKQSAGAADRSAGRQPSQDRAVQDRSSDRGGSPSAGRDNAFGGMDRGGQASRDSARGSQSMSSARSHGGGASGGLSRGGGASRPSGGASRGGGGRGRR